jgi:hypothetical protein
MELRMEQTTRVNRGDMAFIFTPKAERLNALRAEGKSFDEALAIADREFTSDGLLPRRGVTSLDSVRIEQNGMVQF